MAIIPLPYGTGHIRLDTRNHPHLTVLQAGHPRVLADPLAAVRSALSAPAGTLPLAELIRQKQPGKIVVVVNDETRPTPYEAFFPPLLEVFAQCGIRDEQVTFLIATGLHPAHDEALNRKVYGDDMVGRFRFVSHRADEEQELADLGTLASGIPLKLNRLVVEADFVITLGVVMPHYFAGFSGGRKSILPGVAGHETIERNHARMLEIIDHLPDIHSNPISLEMLEGARRGGVDFIINAVVTDTQDIVFIAAGDLEEAWYKATEVCRPLYEVPLDRPADLCIATASGYPRDVNMYQAQKALDHADHGSREGGDILLLAEAPKGLGEHVFEQWLLKRLPPGELMSEVKKHFVIGGHKAYGFARVAARKKLHFCSSLDEKIIKLLYAEKVTNVQRFYDTYLQQHPQAEIVILPEGSVTLPVCEHSA